MPTNQFVIIKQPEKAKWQSEIIEGIKQASDLIRSLPLSQDEKKSCQLLENQFPLLIPPGYIKLIDWNNPDDPLRKLLVPSQTELNDDGSLDTSGEQQSVIIQGLQHKYAQTAVLLTTQSCAGHCRFCFRRRLFDPEELTRETIEDLDAAFVYINNHTEIDNILLTGGDPLLCNTRRLEKIFVSASKIKHIRSLRISTKLPAFLPSRFLSDPDLLTLFLKYKNRFHISLQCHFSHPRELTSESISALKTLQEHGCLLTSQIALMRGINDSASTIAELYIKLHDAGVTPQYLFHPRPVQYATHFQIPISDGLEIVSQARKVLSGPLKRFRYMLANEDGKLELIGRIQSGNQLVVRWHQSRAGLDLQDTLQQIPLTPDLNWLDAEIMNAHR